MRVVIDVDKHGVERVVKRVAKRVVKQHVAKRFTKRDAKRVAKRFTKRIVAVKLSHSCMYILQHNPSCLFK